MFAAALASHAATNDDRSLLNAARKGDMTVVKTSLARGADVNAASNFNITPLRAAAMSGHAAVVKILLSHGADPNIRGNDGMTALSFPKARQQWEIVRMLKEVDARE